MFALAFAGCKQTQEQKSTSNTENKSTESSQSMNESKSQGEEANQVDQSKTVVAMVNDVPIYREDLRGFDVQKALQKELLYQYGLKQGYLDDSIKQRVENFKKSLVISKVKIDAIKDYMALNPVTPEEIDSEYKQNKQQFTYLKLNELEIADKDTADKVYNEAKSGTSLKDLGSKYGDKVKFSEMDRSTKRFNRFFNDLKPGSVSELINNNGKYYIYKVEDTTQLPTPDVRRRLRLEKEAEKKRTAINNLVQKIKQSGDFKVKMMNNSSN